MGVPISQLNTFRSRVSIFFVLCSIFSVSVFSAQCHCVGTIIANIRRRIAVVQRTMERSVLNITKKETRKIMGGERDGERGEVKGKGAGTREQE